MNCFNIREVQALLKQRFFADLINDVDQRVLLNPTMIGAKFRFGGQNLTMTDNLLAATNAPSLSEDR